MLRAALLLYIGWYLGKEGFLVPGESNVLAIQEKITTDLKNAGII